MTFYLIVADILDKYLLSKHSKVGISTKIRVLIRNLSERTIYKHLCKSSKIFKNLFEDLQLKDKYDILPIFVDLMEINDIGVFHFGQDMNFFLNILPRHSSSRRLQSFLFNKFCCIFVTSVLLQYSKNCSKLAAEKGK